VKGLLHGKIVLGCWGYSPAPRSIVCHWDGDHIPATPGVRIYAPFFPPEKYRKYARNFSKLDLRDLRNNVISTEDFRLIVRPVTLRDVKEITGVEHRFHSSSRGAIPLLLLSDSEAYLYIDDLDTDDFEVLEELVDYYQTSYEDLFKGVVVPVYLGTNAHKSRYPVELRELSMKFVEKMVEKGLEVYVIPHADGVTKNFIISNVQKGSDKIHVIPRIYQPVCRAVTGH